jgi:preprotein translocase subunit SecG
MFLRNKVGIILVIFFLLFPLISFSQSLVPCGQGSDPNNACTLCHLIVGIQNIIGFARDLLITVAAVGIFISGFMYIISSGNEQMVTKAKGFLSASLTGFTIVLMAWFIVNIIITWILPTAEGLGIERESWNKITCTAKASSAIKDASVVLAVGALSDPVARNKLLVEGILVNHLEPTTSLKGIPERVVENLIKIKKKCGGEVVVTGGTEGGHKTHGPGKPIVDLRWREDLAKCIRQNVGSFNVEKICLHSEGQAYVYNCSYVETNPHIHIAFK